MFALKINDGEAKCKFINEAVREKLDRMDNELIRDERWDEEEMSEK